MSERSVSGFSKAKRSLDGIISNADFESSHKINRSDSLDSKLEPWVLHDLRRTAVTGMADLGVQPHVIEAVVNHVSGHGAGVAGIYNRASYAVEKKVALERWSDHIINLIGEKSGDNALL
ncbi:MAG: hypothetical protein AAGA21_18970 [Pseudomonadota bacterium]